jgi:2-dehydropantoate 2-reductase
MRILIVGAGATGGYFGARLAQAGRDVTFLVRSARAEKLRAGGLNIISPHGDFSITPNLVTADQLAAPFDIILLSVKAYALDAALRDIAPAIGPNTMILPVLNGMKHMETISARFGYALIGGVCKIAGTIDTDGRVVQMTNMHDLAYGEINGAISERIRQLDAVMKNAGFDARLSPDIDQDMWEKWVMLATIGGITCLMRGAIGAVEAAGGADFALAFLEECAAIATAEGHGPSPDLITGLRAMVTAKGSPMTTSMYRDLIAGNAVEGEQIIGDLWRRAQAHGIPAPLLAATSVNLAVYSGKLAGL